jgi:hypothetical protein
MQNADGEDMTFSNLRAVSADLLLSSTAKLSMLRQVMDDPTAQPSTNPMTYHCFSLGVNESHSSPDSKIGFACLHPLIRPSVGSESVRNSLKLQRVLVDMAASLQGGWTFQVSPRRPVG